MEQAIKGIQNFLKRPRYLRALPSLVILTTAMAWAALPDLDELEDIGKRESATVFQHAGLLQGSFLAARASRQP
jgi:hypothetical protein